MLFRVVQMQYNYGKKTMSDSEFLILAREFKKVTHRSKTIFIVNDRAEIAKKS